VPHRHASYRTLKELECAGLVWFETRSSHGGDTDHLESAESFAYIIQ
jgi:hypothetical protein